MEHMDGDVEKREVSTGGNGREAESERVIPVSRIIGTAGRSILEKNVLKLNVFEIHLLMIS
jgi:hypothetical protein